jgi:sugar phosphate permease
VGRILPPLAILYLANFVDRSNVGNAKILGLATDLNMTNHQYATALSVFFVFYVVSELPSNLILKRMTPKFWLPFLVFITGIIVMCIGFVKTYAQFIVVRILLGIFEGGLYPGSLLFLSTLYTREELALRVGIFYSAASLSGAFGGLLARGLSAISATSTIHGSWRWVGTPLHLFILLLF